MSELFEKFARDRSRRTRNELVEMHMGLARHIAHRFSRGTDTEDLEQAALVALVKAVERFDPERGPAFSTFAGRTIEGELKRYFRDRTWKMRVPRSLKDLRVSVRSTATQLTNDLGRSPTINEIASFLSVEPDSVVEALGAEAARNTESIDAPVRGSDGGGLYESSEMGTSGGFTGVDDRDEVEYLLEHLPERERVIVRLRFDERLSQQAIAERVGISQMHVSRLLRRSLETMRRVATDESLSDPEGS
ncbi:MAG: sigma-70 family RNA polymerase sigma factor [Microthrixaceae bacterium]